LWPLLLLAPLSAPAQEPQPGEGQPSTAPEFLDFLEYLGSWDGAEQDWVQFLDQGEAVPQEDAEEEPVDLEDPNDVVS
jgi:hypothetical protein